MRFAIFGILVAIGVFNFTGSPQSVSSTELVVTEKESVFVVDDFTFPDVTAKAYGVFDIKTGKLLLSYNAKESLPIASVTKLFTAATAFETNSVDEMLTVTTEDVASEGRAGKLVAGEEYRLRELLFPLLLESSNDAAAVFERTLGNIPFAGTYLADASGLSSNNLATVVELAGEVRRVYLTFPQVFDVTRLKQHIGEYTGWVNNSPVHDLPDYRGGKHGYTKDSNRTLAAVFAEPLLDNRELGYIILGSDNLKEDVVALRAVVEGSVHLETVK
ncbi:MAG: D-alanyl-D-alanine carboxypeptidase [Candidatus Paceibacteria bacterium]|jgi:D-alanyl-D-alanine carboxypeptidase